jgi:hypothetical protein
LGITSAEGALKTVCCANAGTPTSKPNKNPIPKAFKTKLTNQSAFLSKKNNGPAGEFSSFLLCSYFNTDLMKRPLNLVDESWVVLSNLAHPEKGIR